MSSNAAHGNHERASRRLFTMYHAALGSCPLHTLGKAFRMILLQVGDRDPKGYPGQIRRCVLDPIMCTDELRERSADAQINVCGCVCVCVWVWV
jgi:hypothetical protein